MPVEPLPNPDLSEYFRNSVDLLSVYEVGGKVGLTNPSWQRVLGWSPEDLEGKDFIDFVHPDDVERTIAANVAEWTNHRQRARDSRADSVVVTERTVGLNGRRSDAVT